MFGLTWGVFYSRNRRLDITKIIRLTKMLKLWPLLQCIYILNNQSNTSGINIFSDSGCFFLHLINLLLTANVNRVQADKQGAPLSTKPAANIAEDIKTSTTAASHQTMSAIAKWLQKKKTL